MKRSPEIFIPPSLPSVRQSPYFVQIMTENSNPSSKTVTKRDLVTDIANRTGLTQQKVFEVIQLTLDDITRHLAHGNQVVMRNFGTFQVRRTKKKIGRNPNQPGTDVVIPPRSVVKFKPGKEMKERVDGARPTLD